MKRHNETSKKDVKGWSGYYRPRYATKIIQQHTQKIWLFVLSCPSLWLHESTHTGHPYFAIKIGKFFWAWLEPRKIIWDFIVPAQRSTTEGPAVYHVRPSVHAGHWSFFVLAWSTSPNLELVTCMTFRSIFLIYLCERSLLLCGTTYNTYSCPAVYPSIPTGLCSPNLFGG